MLTNDIMAHTKKKGKESEESLCFRLERSGQRGKDGEEMTAKNGRKGQRENDSKENTDFHKMS